MTKMDEIWVLLDANEEKWKPKLKSKTKRQLAGMTPGGGGIVEGVIVNGSAE